MFFYNFGHRNNKCVWICYIVPMFYILLQIGQENWGADNSSHALKAEATWLPFVKLKCERDPVQEQKIVQLRTKNDIDELLRVQSKFIQITDAEVSLITFYTFVNFFLIRNRSDMNEPSVMLSCCYQSAQKSLKRYGNGLFVSTCMCHFTRVEHKYFTPL